MKIDKGLMMLRRSLHPYNWNRLKESLWLDLRKPWARICGLNCLGKRAWNWFFHKDWTSRKEEI